MKLNRNDQYGKRQCIANLFKLSFSRIIWPLHVVHVLVQYRVLTHLCLASHKGDIGKQ